MLAGPLRIVPAQPDPGQTGPDGPPPSRWADADGLRTPVVGRRRDATLATAGLCGVLLVTAAVDAPVSGPAAGLGAMGGLTLEALSQLRADAVRRVWERPVVQASTTVTGTAVTGAVALGVVGRPAWLWALVGGLCVYLLVLAVVAARARVGRRPGRGTE